MKLIAILGSPKKGGNTDTLLEKVLEQARAPSIFIQKIILNDLDIRPCQECNDCLKTGICQIQDDMAVVYKALDESDIVIVASPIFFGSVSAQTKIMIDRMQCSWARKYLLKKKNIKGKRYGAFISCGGLKKEEYFRCASKIIDIFFRIQDIEYKGELFAGGIDKHSDILKYKDILEKAYDLGNCLINNK